MKMNRVFLLLMMVIVFSSCNEKTCDPSQGITYKDTIEVAYLTYNDSLEIGEWVYSDTVKSSNVAFRVIVEKSLGVNDLLIFTGTTSWGDSIFVMSKSFRHPEFNHVIDFGVLRLQMDSTIIVEAITVRNGIKKSIHKKNVYVKYP